MYWSLFPGLLHVLPVLLGKGGVGCHIIPKLLAAFLLTDNMALLSPSRCAMPHILNICCDHCGRFCLAFSVQTKLMFWKLCIDADRIEPLLLDGETIEIVTKGLYLGFRIVSGKSFPFRLDMA